MEGGRTMYIHMYAKLKIEECKTAKRLGMTNRTPQTPILMRNYLLGS